METLTTMSFSGSLGAMAKQRPAGRGPHLTATAALALLILQAAGAAPSVMLGGRPDFALRDLPDGRFRREIEALPATARERAVSRLRTFTFPAADAAYLHADSSGGILYADAFPPPPPAPAATASAALPVEPEGSVEVSPFPASLKFHSRPGAPNTIFLDFDGHLVTGTAWNTELGRDPIPAVAFSTDGDYATYSDTEQTAIRRIWQRVSEDYAPFDVDVTTEAPAVFTTRTAHALITRSTDANGETNLYSTSGGVAYIGVFGESYYAQYRPAWIYTENLGGNESYIGEAASHELGHNMGLSHDGTTAGAGYYEGHGSGATSWAPIMGFSYLKTVTQWSKGDYYLANNTQDDLAIIAGKLTYRVDDRGGTTAGAAFLQMTAGTNIAATTPETDPANVNPANKGVIASAADVDMWALVTGDGPVRIDVKPWISPSGARGGNLDVRLRLLDGAGTPVAEADPPLETVATIAADLTNGVYYLEVRGTGTGAPLANPPSGYTAYASIGQYFISGWLQSAVGVAVPPSAELAAGDIAQTGHTGHTFTVTYTDNTGVDVSTLDGGDIRVTGPNGYSQLASFQGVSDTSNGSPRAATYRIEPPSTTWAEADNGTYTVDLVTHQVADIEGAYALAQTLGTFTCRVPRLLYAATMSEDPVWMLDSGWAFGPPAGAGGDPSAGWDGTNVVGYNLDGEYVKNLARRYATTPAFDCSSATSVTLQYQRWLGVVANDTATIEVSANGGGWVPVWNASGTINDSVWTAQSLDLTAVAAGRAAVRIRWGMGSNTDKQTSCGWNLDNVEVVGSAPDADTRPPGATLNATPLTLKDQPVYAFTVTYTDDTAVAVATLDGGDVLVTGPGGYSNLAALAGADSVADATPLTATYRLAGPGGTWDPSENGTYTVALLAGAVEDTAGNPIAAATLGTFAVAVPTQTWTLVTGVNDSFRGSISPASGTFNAGTTVKLTAVASNYYVFTGWSGDLSGTANPATVVMDANRTVYAAFDVAMTTNHPTPHWWLAEYGFTNDFEQAVESIGANGYALWESYIAGLNPADPTSVVRLVRLSLDEQRGLIELGWQTVSGRLYSVYYAPTLPPSYEPVPGGLDIPWTQPGYTGLLWVTRGFWQLRTRTAD